MSGGAGAIAPSSAVGHRLGLLFRRQPMGAVGLVLVLMVVLAAIFAPQLAAYAPEALSGPALAAPSGAHWFGTDDLGRDVFSRVIHGGRISLGVGAVSVLLGCVAGTGLGLLSGYQRGWLDLAIQRIVDSLMAFPTLVLALAIVAALGTKQRNVTMAITIAMIPQITRIIRGSVLGVCSEVFVEAARGLGVRVPRILLRHILPNLVGPIVVVATAFFGTAIVTEAALSFVGLGTPPPTPSWGNMMSGSARTYITSAPWMAFYPGVALSLLVFGVNIVGDAIRDVLDPRLRT
ncbi:MAG TPA: ABC transporter permease [Candidatus Methylomirabilis sp.]|nr:ABC transporter permease [Candidatus Methylomirabilis sp.]